MRQELKTLFAGLLGPVEVALLQCQPSYPGQCHSPHLRRHTPVDCQRRFEPSPALAVVAPPQPKEAESSPQPERHLCLFASQGPSESRPHVVVLGFQALQPLKLVCTYELWMGLFGQGEEILGVSPLDLLGL